MLYFSFSLAYVFKATRVFNTWVGLCQCFLSTVLLSSVSVALCTNFNNNNNLSVQYTSASEMTYIVSGGALNSTHSLCTINQNGRHIYTKWYFI